MSGQRDRIAFVKSLRAFGEESLGLDFDGSFARCVSRYRTANWLYAVRPDGFTSALPGNDVFLFSWDLARARRRERAHRRRGDHTYLYSAEAHGGANCPITPSLLAAPRARQAYVVLHEAWHATLRRGHVSLPYALEEATGRVVGVYGAVLFASLRGDAELLRETRAQARDWGAFAAFVNRAYSRLRRAYRSGAGGAPAALRREILLAARGLRRRTISAWEREELARELNNAFFFRYYDYTRYYPLALRVHRRAGSLRRTLSLYRRAGELGAPRYLRELLPAGGARVRP